MWFFFTSPLISALCCKKTMWKISQFLSTLFLNIFHPQKRRYKWWHQGRDFVVAPFIGQDIGEDQKKGLRCKTSWCSVFSPKVCDDQKKKRSLPTHQWVFGLKRKKNRMVTPEAGRPTPLATPLFTLLSFAKNFSHRRSQDF